MTQDHQGYDESSKIFVGPWGGQNGVRWDDGFYNTVRQVIICHGAAIDSIQIEYDMNGNSVWSVKHGGSGGVKTSKVNLDHPEEYLVSLSGYYGSTSDYGPMLVRSLTMESNRKKYGPFGIQQGTPFSLPVSGAKVVGFHGRSSWFLDSIGVYLKPLLQPNLSSKFQTASHNNKLNVVDEFQVDTRQKSPIFSNNFNATEIVTTGNNGITTERFRTSDGFEVERTRKVIISTTQGIMSPKTVRMRQSIVSCGPWGGNGGMAFDEGVSSGVREMHITSYGGGIISVRVCYDQNGQSIWGNKHGGNGGTRLDKIAFGYPFETLTHITGFYGPIALRGAMVVKSLTIHTNNRKYGPFGEEQGFPFSSAFKNGFIVGFHGREGSLIDCIGVHVDESPTSMSRTLSPSSSPFDLPFNLRTNDNLYDSSFEPFNINNIKLYDYEVTPIASPTTAFPTVIKPMTMKDNTMPTLVKDTRPTILKDKVPKAVPETVRHTMTSDTLPVIMKEPKHKMDTMVKNTMPKSMMPTGMVKTVRDTIPVVEPRGPWGGNGGKAFDDGVFTGVRKIFITKGEAIYCITIEYDQNGVSVWSMRRGSGVESTSYMIKLDYPNEVLTGISGYYDSLVGDESKSVIKSLTFYTNKGKHGPHGEQSGTYFSSTKHVGKIVGFHGRSSCYLNAVGVYVQPHFHNINDNNLQEEESNERAQRFYRILSNFF